MAFKKVKVTESMDAEKDKGKHASVTEELGRIIRVYRNSTLSVSSDASSSSNEEADDFYDLTPEDYYHIISSKIGAKSQVLKTKKLREAEATAHRERLTKAVVRVCFPDDYVMEAEFHPSERIQVLMDLLNKVLAQPDLPFYLYTIPPKEKIKDMSMDFYLAGFAPGAIVYFSYDLPKDNPDATTGPYLRSEIMSLHELPPVLKNVDFVNPEPEPEIVKIIPTAPEPKPVSKKSTKPKWFK
ncbi:plant UBX domain-containing protein 1-like [Iris pallida]|uniref:Plant UBX domain-containing protein 1-like n=1 Tax=Iris pallida TaxID=29817 RepID=A0AAX6ICS5_IRIPA|nr:plant UBX domain-containing protein 1-like [Iris pallida]